MTPHGPFWGSQGVSLISGPRHPHHLTPSSVLTSWDGHHVPPVDFVGLLKSLGSPWLPYLAWDIVPGSQHSVRDKVSHLQPGCLDPNIFRIRSPCLPCIFSHFDHCSLFTPPTPFTILYSCTMSSDASPPWWLGTAPTVFHCSPGILGLQSCPQPSFELSPSTLCLPPAKDSHTPGVA